MIPDSRPRIASLVDTATLETAFYSRRPEIVDRGAQARVVAGCHRGSPLDGTFTESHVLAITQAICDYRRRHDIRGPLFVGRDAHAVSEAAFMTAVEVLAGNHVDTFVDAADTCTPAPAISHAVLTHNHGRTMRPADAIALTPGDERPEQGGIRYSLPTGGAADGEASAWIERRANELLQDRLQPVMRLAYERARRAATTRRHDYLGFYVDDLIDVVDMEAIAGARLRIAVDPLGGATARYWSAMGERYGIDIEILHRVVDPVFGFVSPGPDGRIDVDGAPPHAMAALVSVRDRFDLGFGNDADGGCHGIVTSAGGLMAPHDYAAAAMAYLFSRRGAWPPDAGVGTTAARTRLIDRVAAKLRRPIVEVPGGFEDFVPGLLDGSIGLAVDAHARGTVLRRDGTVWTTDADGLVLNLIAAELTVRTGQDPAQLYAALMPELAGTE